MSTTRGAFALNGRIYTGQSNGTLTYRSFDGTTVGGSNTIDLHGLEVAPGGGFLIPGTTTPVPGFNTHLSSMTGMFFENGRPNNINPPRLQFAAINVQSTDQEAVIRSNTTPGSLAGMPGRLR